tara:strand:+ start:2548 stop:2847 length:300 start_codon:yes stop_codon:yes gene_type:complete
MVSTKDGSVFEIDLSVTVGFFPSALSIILYFETSSPLLDNDLSGDSEDFSDTAAFDDCEGDLLARELESSLIEAILDKSGASSSSSSFDCDFFEGDFDL